MVENEIELGEVAGDGLRLWLAEQAVRHAELRLAAQAGNLQALETRASSLLQWSVSVALALITLAVTTPALRAPAEAAGVMMALTALFSAWPLLPSPWSISGLSPEVILPDENEQEPTSSQLLFLEGTARTYGRGITANDDRLLWFGKSLRLAWFCFAAAPVIAVLALPH
jgi:hypothetical protein